MSSQTEGYQIMSPTTTYVSTDIRPDNNFDQPGVIWTDLDPTVGWRRFVWVKNSGATTTAVGDVLVWTDIYKFNVSTAQADSARNCLRGVAVGVAVTNSYLWAQTDGYCPVVQVDSSTFALGTFIMISGTDKLGTTAGSAGTAPVYPVIGVALAASTGSNPYYVTSQLGVGKF